ncbi:hypothetical protein RIF29_27642 [Crotalaria pallida]|uniref:Uncharacterized protein n=1 Tax=Crotalaria pallida TaxID=3830 RepID=A0AAN9EWN7_CROPI
MPSPLRRSVRNRNLSFSSPSDSKSSGSSSSKLRPKREKSVRQLTFEAKEVTENDEHELGTSQVTVKRMDARMYRATFRKPKEGPLRLQEPNRIYKSTQEGGPNGGGKVDECCRLNGPAKGLLENNVTLGSLQPSNATHETTVALQSVQPDCIEEETLQMLVSTSSNVLSDENLVKNSVGHDSGEKLIPSKRKGIIVDMDSNVSATLVNDNSCNLIAEVGPSRLGGSILGTGEPCSKRRRLDCDRTVSCNNESCKPSAIEDVGDCDASMLQKECPANPLVDIPKNICVICKGEGQLRFCGGKGCNGCYHPSCLEPPLVNTPIGFWHCHSCVRKKLELGVYSVSEGAESVCDVREVPLANVDGSATQKEFLVKYVGLAHVHNRWVPENQLLLEAPSLHMKYNQKDQTQRSKPEWSLPHRLLQKRVLSCVKQHDDHRANHIVDNFRCGFEWLVKWRGLGYEHATWELDNASFFHSPESQSLIRGYEERFQRAKRVSLHAKINKESDSRCSVIKLSQMGGGVSSVFGNSNLLDAVNKLREHWHKGQSAIVIDDHERILKVVAFMASLHSDIYRPFLIISTVSSLHSWEDEFYQLDPSIDVVIYSGNKEMRDSIRRLEFYDEGGCILFQVLIVVPEILVEDIDVLGSIEWEGIIVDGCQSPEISSYFRQIKMLKTNLKILLFGGQLKDTIEEYINILAVLDCQGCNEKDGSISNSGDNIVELKERLSSHIAYNCKINSCNFVEYWVPVQLSNVQLEQYCATLHSNASILGSSPKVDTAAALRDILHSTRKCCNHPYIVDRSLLPLLTKGLQDTDPEYVDIGIKASGKLQLLDSMLKELRKKDLKALILFQSSVGGCDILEDLLRLRFGKDSYEGIIGKHIPLSKKQRAMKKFNNKDNGCFIFLLETLACHRSIKLSSVNVIIIFNSDWNPMNDVRSLQKITLDLQFEFVKIFRLYSSFTVEEKALIIAKQHKTPDISLQNISPSTSHMLLMWGVSCLFDDLRVFHDGETSVSNLKSLFGGQSHLKAVGEFSSILSQDGEDNDTSSCSYLLKVQQNGGRYRGDFSLLGEQKLSFLDEEPPHIFWTKLLEGKQFKWKYSFGSSQRSRKKVLHVDGSVDRPDLVNEGVSKKRRKVSNNTVDQPSSKSGGQKLSSGIKAGTSENLSGDLEDGDRANDVESEKNRRLRDEQRSLHLLLKPRIARLCEVHLLPDNIKSMVDSFLEYIIHNHHIVNKETESTILQTFQISLIWAAAAFLKHKLDHDASLILAKEHLNFDCKKSEGDYIYSMLRCLKKIFLYRTGHSVDTGSPKGFESSNRVYSSTAVAREVELFKKDLSESIKEIKKKFKKKLTKLHLRQEEEKQRLKAGWEDYKAEVQNKYTIESVVIEHCSPNALEKLEDLGSNYDKAMEELECKHEISLKDLEDKQSAEILELQNSETAWVEDLRSWANNEFLNIEGDGHENFSRGSGDICNGETPDVPNREVAHEVYKTSSSNDGQDIIHSSSQGTMGMSGTVNVTGEDAVDEVLDRVLTRPCVSASPSSGPHNIILSNPPLEHQVPGVSSSLHDGQIPLEVPDTSHEEDTVSLLEREVPAEMPGMVKFTECQANTTPVDTPPSRNQISDKDSLNVPVLDDVLSSRPCGATSPSNGPVTDPILNQQQISCGVSIPDGDIPVIVPENSHAVADCRNLEPLTNDGLVSTLDRQEGESGTMTESMSQDTPVSRSVAVLEPLQQVQQLSSLVCPPDQDTAGEMQTSSEQVGLVSCPVDVLPANQSSHASLIMNPSEPAQQLPTAVPNQDVRPNSNLGLDSHSHQAVMHPSSNSNLGPLLPGRVRIQSPDTRNLSTPSEINNQNHAMPAATYSASRMPPPMCADPLKYESERIKQATEQIKKNHEDMKLRLKSDFEKEYEALRMKYDIKFQEVETEFQQTKKNLETSLSVVRMNKILAEAFKSKCMVHKGSGAIGMQQGAGSAHQLSQHPSRQGATRPSMVSGPSSGGPIAASLQNPSSTVSSQNAVAPIRPAYNTSRVFSGDSARPPLIHSVSSPLGSLQAGGDMRAPAPHLRPYSPSTSVPATGLPVYPRGIPIHSAPSNMPATSAFSHGPARPRPTTYQSHPHMGVQRPDSAVGLPTATDSIVALNSQSGVDVPNVQSRMSDGTSLNPSGVGNSSREAPNLVYLSDDD